MHLDALDHLAYDTHTVTVATTDDVQVDDYKLFHDFLRVSYVAAYNEDAAYNRVFEAELADFNKLLGNSVSTVKTETAFEGYSGGGYVTGLNQRSVADGGGIRFTVVTEKSGLYNLTLRYQADSAGSANIYVGNTALTLDRVNKTVSLASGSGWQTVTASVYLQKGINVVDLDTTVDAKVDYLRVRELSSQTHSTTIEAEDAIPESMNGLIQTAQSSGASGGKYVVGMPGAYTEAERQYLEFTYNAPAAGKYQMQVFHSNDDIAGSHGYNIKAIDKYAVFEVNGQSDSPNFKLAETDGEPLTVYYFIDCGDHDPSTVSEGDSFGQNNSVTDQIYGADKATTYSWGVVLENADTEYHEKELDWHAGDNAQSPDDKAIYTTYQRACASSLDDLKDGKPKTGTFRYAHGQDTAGISTRYISYAFELDPGKYDITVCMGDTWGNATTPAVTLSAGGVADICKNYLVSGNTAHTMTIDLTNAAKQENGRVKLSVKATSNNPTIQMNYILITAAADPDGTKNIVTLPGNVKVEGGSALPEDIYIGELTDGVTKYMDFRNLKSNTDRYFFINTFSNDTFREKTITLDLAQGENKIRIYNDNSWNVTYGGSTSVPGLEEVTNYTPNFDKFVITPMALDTADAQTPQYNVTVSSASGGTASSSKTLVEEGGAYTITITAESQQPTVYVNGEIQQAQKQEDGTYRVTVSNVTTDQKVEVYFLVSTKAVQDLVDELKNMDLTGYTSTSRALLEQAIAQAEDVLKNPTATKLLEIYDLLKQAKESLSPAIPGLIYFVDCGDHDPATVTGTADDFGSHNSVTDQIYGADTKTGYQWGVVLESSNEQILDWRAGSQAQSPEDKAVYTTYQRALSNGYGDLADGLAKEATFRYAHEQNGIDPRYVSYAFELEPGTYDVTVCMGARNDWGNNSKHSKVTLSAQGAEAVSTQYDVPDGGNQVETMTIDLTHAAAGDNNLVTLSVKGTTTSGDATVQMNYIKIIQKSEEHQHSWSAAWTYNETHHWHECTADGCTVTDNANKDGYAEHTWDEGTVTTAATETENGEKTFKCTLCGATKTEIIPALGHRHSAVFVAGTAATCTQPGTKEHWHCAGCGQNFSDEGCQTVLDSVTLPAEGHALKHIDRVEPTTEAAGNIEYWICSKCGSKFKDTDGLEEVTAVTLPKLDKPSRPSNPIIPILPILSGNTEAKFPFKDVSKADWYYDSVRLAWKNDLIDGVTATEFRPGSTLTVAQAIKLAAALHQLEHVGKVTLRNGSPWYSSYVEYAVANDIIEKAYQNYTDAQMNAPVTRGEFVHIFHGAESACTAINTVADNVIPDVKSTDKYAAEVYEFYRAGILTGSDAKGTFHSASSIKRSEVSAILVRMFDTASRQRITLK